MMTALCDEFAFLTDNYGFRIEVPPAHSGLMGMALPWQSGKQLKNDMLNIAHFAPFIALVRDKYTGRIVLDKQNQPIIQYNLHNYDKNHLVRGLEEAVKLHVAAGATEIITPHTQALRFNPATDSLKKFIEQMRNAAWEPNRFILFSAHQMGTCRMGGRDKHHCLKPNGETREVRNLFVADASAFPQCSGVNPMLTIQALAWFIAQQLYV
jgi:choline dehydrogenase-like flavoprotein